MGNILKSAEAETGYRRPKVLADQVGGMNEPQVYEVSWLADPNEVEIIDHKVRFSKRVVDTSPDAAIYRAGVKVSAR